MSSRCWFCRSSLPAARIRRRPRSPRVPRLKNWSRCARTPSRRAEEEARRRAEAEAAAARERAIAAARDILGQTVYFDYDDSDITAASEQMLRDKVEILRNNPSLQIRIEGHADERGTNEYNLALGTRRAEAVRQFMTSFGLDASRFAITSYGEERPAVDGSSEEAWSQNRRAEFIITGGTIDPGM